jgi:hypothetical protein
MSFLQYGALDFLIVRHTDPSHVSNHTLLVLSETKGLAFHYISPEFLGLFIFFLTLSYILGQC